MTVVELVSSVESASGTASALPGRHFAAANKYNEGLRQAKQGLIPRPGTIDDWSSLLYKLDVYVWYDY